MHHKESVALLECRSVHHKESVALLECRSVHHKEGFVSACRFVE